MIHYVYRLHDNSGNVVYIGQTENINARIKRHEKAHSYATFIEVEGETIGKMLEAWLLYVVNPVMNIQVPKEMPKLPRNWLLKNKLKYKMYEKPI